MSLPERELIKRALELGEYWHKGQVRKYSERPYFTHPKKVAEAIWEELKDKPGADAGEFDYIIAAAILHDVVEDTKIPLDKFDILGEDSRIVLGLVLWLTNNKGLRGSRALRKFDMFNRITGAPIEARLIKMVDRLDNVTDLTTENPQFLKDKYLDESLELVNAAHTNLDSTSVSMHISRAFYTFVNRLLDLLGKYEK